MGPGDLLQKRLKSCEEMSGILRNAREVVVFDLETTGFSAQKHAEIIEIGAIHLDLEAGKAVKGFHRYVKPANGTIPPKIQSLTGITTDMVRNAEYIEDVLPEFYQFIRDYPVVAHNARFDWFRFVQPYMLRVGRIVTNEVICTLELSKLLHKVMKKHNLAELCEYYGHPITGHHSALADAKFTASLCLKMRREIIERGAGTYDLAGLEANILPSCVGFDAPDGIRVKSIRPYQYKNKRLGTAIFCTTSFGTIYYIVDRDCWGFQNMTVAQNVDILQVVKEILRQQGLTQEVFVKKFVK